MYKAVTKGARVLNIVDAFKQTGLNEKGEPRLAIARADWRTVQFSASRANQWHEGNSGHFWRHWRKTAEQIYLPDNTFDQKAIVNGQLSTAVPHIPPEVRPNIALSNFHILFEVEEWTAYPVDPFLLRRIAGDLYIVVAEWELTELEASLLGSMRSGN